jgi:hypothetical protein
MNNSGVFQDLRSLIFSPSKLFRFFQSYEQLNPWAVYKILWIFFIVSIIKNSTLAYQHISSGDPMGFFATMDLFGLFEALKPYFVWFQVWGIIVSPFLAISKILSWAALTYLILDLLGAEPSRIGFSKLFLVLCLLSWLEIFVPLSFLTHIWIFFLSIFAVHKIYRIPKSYAFIALTGSFWITMGSLYLIGAAGLGGLMAFLN